MISSKSSSSDQQLWKGRTSGRLRPIAIEIGESISLDIKLYREDLKGSAAHAAMLAKIGILSKEELLKIQNGLREICKEIETARFELSLELEDIHTHIEDRLIQKIGDTAKKLHTARSRNDQVAVDTHLFVRRASSEIARELTELLEAFYKKAEQELDTVLPGYTHLQVAQPIRLAHHLLAHFWSFEKDLHRLEAARRQASRLPLGSGAMAGVNYPTDREFLCRELGFDSIAPNSMDAVASRDHILDFLYACSTIMVHASRICEELILWNSVEFGFLHLPDDLTTGSSIMPQKKNPDLAELIRGKFGRVHSALVNIFVTLKSLPLTYNRDLQEDRLPMLDARKQLLLSLQALKEMIRGAEFRRERMQRSLEEGYATATDLADALVNQKGVPFREAHHLVGALVGKAVERKSTLSELPQELRAEVSSCFADDGFYYEAIDLGKSADRKISYGGTAREQIKTQLQEARAVIQKWKEHDWKAPLLSF